jgi:tryptophan 2,3-dioxygenase
VRELTDWLIGQEKNEFPYDLVVAEYHRVGKHFAPDGLVASLCQAREHVRVLEKFLDTALDKRDGRYDYRTYLGLDLLPLPGAGSESPDPVSARSAHDRLIVLLTADALRFELDALEGRTGRFPEQRPDAELVGKRLHLGLRAVDPMWRRIGGRLPDGSSEPLAAALAFCERVEGDRAPVEQRALILSDLPVYVVHDEYMFIRVLQSFETAFAYLAVCLKAAIEDVDADRIEDAAGRLHGARATLREAARFFPLLATMQVESFRTFRLYTEGASAIQSRNYKLVESLCRTPDQPRLDSPAYESVPEVRADVLAGQRTLGEALRDAVAASRIEPEPLRELRRAMDDFGSALTQWRQTHYSLAVRMLGERSGTGYTEGTPYLNEVRGIPVFLDLEDEGGDGEHGHEAEGADA